MTTITQTRTARPAPSLLRVLVVRCLCAVAWWSLLLTFALLLAAPPYAFRGYEIASLVACFALSDQGTALLWTPLTPRLSERLLFGIGPLLAATALLGLAQTTAFGACAGWAILVGIGSSLTTLAARLWIVAHYTAVEPRLRAFGTQYRIVNAAAAAAPLLVFTLPFQQHAQATFFGVAGVYGLAALVAIAAFPTTMLPTTSEPLDRKACSATIPWGPVAAITAAFGLSLFFLFQIHLLPFYYAQYRTRPAALGGILAIPPLIVVLGQGRVTNMVQQWNRRSLMIKYIVGFAFFTIAFASFSHTDTVAMLVLFVITLTLGEMHICAYVDHDVSLLLPPTAVRTYFALNGLWFAMARASAEGGGIATLHWLAARGDSVLWWWRGNALVALVAGLVAGGIYYRRTRSQHTPTAAATRGCEGRPQ